jgi:hypothetical protein
LATATKNRARALSPGKSRHKTATTVEAEVEVDLRPLQPAELDAVRLQITNLVGNRALEAVDQTIEHIKRGNFQAMKYLFEMVGLFPATGPAEAAVPEGSLAKILLNYLGSPEEQTRKGGVVDSDPKEKVDADAIK